MASYVLSKDTELHVADTADGVYTLVAGGLTIDESDEAADDEEIYTFGSLAPIVEEGEDDATITFTCLFSPDDTDGQVKVRAARRTGGTKFFRLLWDGPDGIAGEQFEGAVRSFNRASDRNGTGQNKFVRGTITIRRVGTITTVEPAE